MHLDSKQMLGDYFDLGRGVCSTEGFLVVSAINGYKKLYSNAVCCPGNATEACFRASFRCHFSYSEVNTSGQQWFEIAYIVLLNSPVVTSHYLLLLSLLISQLSS